MTPLTEITKGSKMRPEYRFRRFQPADASACLKLFDLNQPRYFAEHERAEFFAFLARPIGEYLLVTTLDGEPLACGGFVINTAKRAAGLCWDVVRPDQQRRGIGRMLLTERLRRIRLHGGADVVLLDTSQHSVEFYQRCGFQLNSRQADGYAAGLHRIEMCLPLNAERKA